MIKAGTVGVYYHKASGKWAAQIRNGREVIHIGLYKNKANACRAYDKQARRLGKKVLNFVDGGHGILRVD